MALILKYQPSTAGHTIIKYKRGIDKYCICFIAINATGGESCSIALKYDTIEFGAAVCPTVHAATAFSGIISLKIHSIKNRGTSRGAKDSATNTCLIECKLGFIHD